ncbi:hypothetical protein RN001_001536 [Aquatica leii]|uniref:Rab-like protein 3 n=1 Tax=Aquatica leii TaxID=1421715 RepID=A0AAN7PBR3_9COLE|nr:hypothetical protein RN001_001536 [Aquatica leii]
MSAIERVRIMVLGDSGVGKTSLIHLIAHNEPLRSPSWTIGCNIEVKLHEYKESTPEQTTYFVEFWDVGGSHNHRNTRQVFYNPCHGVILVHDLTNRKSEEHLHNWLEELINQDCNMGASLNSVDEWDTENFFGSTQLPILIIGTKLDLAEDKKFNFKGSKLANQLSADEIILDCRQVRYIAAGTSNAVKLTRFYDKVIEKRSQRNHSKYTDRYGLNISSSILPSKFYSPTHQD